MEKLATLSSETQGATEEASSLPNKYHYPEFAGWNGERYLKKLLRQILPMALYRTWEIFADHQAIGNECYLGVTHLAEIAGRTTRTMEKNLASLCAKQLLVERAERKVFRSSTGAVKSTIVTIKDFAGLYALAHEYHEWLNADEYIAADREMIAFMERSPSLIAKLRRFDNYRKVLYNRQPGPLSRAREEDRWFTEYQPEQYFAATEHEQAKGEKQSQRDTIPAKDPIKHLANDVAKGSAKRITKSNIQNRQERDSFDSALSSSSENSLKDVEGIKTSGKPQRTSPITLDEPTREKQKENASLSLLLTPTPLVQREHLNSLARGQESEESPGAVTRTGRARARTGIGQANPAGPVSDDQAAPSHLLASSFVREIAAPFGDLNQKGTTTRVLSLLKDTHLDRPAEVLLCLIQAYVVARDTRTIRPEHSSPETGQANRMPLFCTLFQRFVEARVQGRMRDYSWQQMEKEITADNRLAWWWNEHQHLVGEPFDNALNEPDKESLIVDAPVCRTRHPRLSQNDRAFMHASVGTSKPPTTVGRSIHQPDQYEIYVNALMAKYSAPETLQEVI